MKHSCKVASIPPVLIWCQNNKTIMSSNHYTQGKKLNRKTMRIALNDECLTGFFLKVWKSKSSESVSLVHCVWWTKPFENQTESTKLKAFISKINIPLYKW